MSQLIGRLGTEALASVGLGSFANWLATTLSIWLGTLIYIGFGIRHAWDEGFLHRRPTWTMLVRQMRLSLPASLQQLFFAAGMVALMGLGVIVFGKPILAIFLTDPETLAVAWVPMLITGAIIGIDTAGLAVMHALLGAGATHQHVAISPNHLQFVA